MAKITVKANGPLLVEGMTLHDATGKEFGLGGRAIVALCRCGQSANKPFCDGAHSRCAFASEVAARDLPPPAK